MWWERYSRDRNNISTFQKQSDDRATLPRVVLTGREANIARYSAPYPYTLGKARSYQT